MRWHFVLEKDEEHHIVNKRTEWRLGKEFGHITVLTMVHTGFDFGRGWGTSIFQISLMSFGHFISHFGGVYVSVYAFYAPGIK